MASPSSTPRNWGTLTWLAAALFILLDVLAVRAAWWEYRGPAGGLQRTVFEPANDGPFHARGVDWRDDVLPRPRWLGPSVLVLPPGFPVSLTSRRDDATSFRVHVYEDRTPLVVLVRSGTNPWSALLTEGASTRVDPLRDPPPVARFHPLPDCFGPGEPQTWSFQHQGELVVDAGRCRWRVEGREVRIVLDSYAAGARVEVDTAGLQAAPAVDGRWLGALFLLALLHRILWRSPRFVAGDALLTAGAFLGSFASPAFVVPWILKTAAGLLHLSVRSFQAGLRHKGAAVAVGTVAALGTLALTLVDRAWVAERVTLAHASADGSFPWRGSLADRVPATTTHLALGYSGVNGVSQDAAAHADLAMDAVLQQACGLPGETWSRHAVDTGDACSLAPRWAESSARLARLQRRLFLGGFQDDVAAPFLSPRALLANLSGVLPSAEPYPSALAAWDTLARMQLDRQEDAVRCAAEVVSSSPAPLLHVADLSSVDLGRARRFGRDALVEARKKAVEKAGGAFVDLRSLMPGESPLYFNDFLHLSALGRQHVARALCPLLRPRRNAETP